MGERFWNQAHRYSTAAIAGAASGAATYGVVGGVGVAALGTAVGITLAPWMILGAAVVTTGYGVYQAGRRAGSE